MAFVTWIPPRKLAVICAIGLAQTAFADPDELQSRDGSASITGNLLSYESGRHRIETELGVLLVSARQVVCLGENCPHPDAIQRDLLATGDMATTNGSDLSVAPAFCPLTGEPLG